MVCSKCYLLHSTCPARSASPPDLTKTPSHITTNLAKIASPMSSREASSRSSLPPHLELPKRREPIPCPPPTGPKVPPFSSTRPLVPPTRTCNNSSAYSLQDQEQCPAAEPARQLPPLVRSPRYHSCKATTSKSPAFEYSRLAQSFRGTWQPSAQQYYSAPPSS